MVQEEGRIHRRGEDIPSVTADAEMTSGMQAKETIPKATLESE